jgi:hypothetical protein
MTHNQDFVYATRDYATKLSLCRDLVTRDPQRALDICGNVTSLLSLDTRLRGHREFAGMVEQQVDLLQNLAEQKLYSPEQ